MTDNQKKAVDLIRQLNIEDKARFAGDRRFDKPPYNSDQPCYYCCYWSVAKENGLELADFCSLCIHNLDWEPV